MPTNTFDLAVTNLMQAVGLLVRRIRSEAHADEISLTEAVVISRLEKDGPATTAELARAEGMKPQSMGTTIASLEELGLVKRKPHPTDGRQVLIELSAKGIQYRKKTGDAKRVWLSQAIAELNDEDRKTILKAGEIIKQLAEK